MSVFGFPTIAETKELIAQKQLDIEAYDRKFKEIRSKLMSLQFEIATEWEKDWKAFRERWMLGNLAAQSAMNAIMMQPSTVILPETAIPSGPAHEIILRSLQKTPGHFQKGDFPDLVDRWTRHNWDAPHIITRQPSSTDIDLEVFKGADEATKVLEKKVFPTLAVGAIAAAVVLGGYLYISSQPIRRLLPSGE